MKPLALITGAAGFSGGRLAAMLAAEGRYRVVGAGLRARSGAWERFVEVDVREAASMDRLISELKPDLVFHLAGRLQGEASALLAANAVGAAHLCEALLRHAPRARLVLAGSSAEYGVLRHGETPLDENTPCVPTAPYGLSKLAATQSALGFHHRLGLKVVVGRPSNIIGPSMPAQLLLGGLAAQLAACTHAGKPPAVTVGNTYPKRDYIDVEDVCRGYLALAELGAWGQCFNLASGVGHSVDDLIHRMEPLVGEPIAVTQDPARMRTGEPEALCFSFEAAQQAFGFTPKISLDASLKALWVQASQAEVS